MSNSKEELHIYLKADDKKASDVLKVASAHEQYIILMNEMLQIKNKENMCTIKDLEHRVSELEDKCDNFDSRRNYLKSLVKNFHEMHKMNEKIINLHVKMNKDTKTCVKKYKSRASWHLRVLHCLLVVVVGLNWEFSDVVNSLVLGSVVITVIAFNHSMLNNLELPSFTAPETQVTNLNKEKKRINDAQDYIHEFIESQ